MNLISLLTGIAMIGASALAMEGIDKATDGNFYLSSVKYLAEESSGGGSFGAPSPISMPAPASGGGEQFQSPTMMPSSSGGGFGGSPESSFNPSDSQRSSGEAGGNSAGSFNKFEPNMMPSSPDRDTFGGQPMNQQPGQMQMPKNQNGSQTSKSFFDFFGGGQKSFGNQQQMMNGNQNGQSGRMQNNQSRSNQPGQSQQGFGSKLMQGIQNSKNSGSGESETSMQIQNEAQQQSFEEEEESGPRIDPKQLQRELKQIQQSLKRAEKILNTKAVQNLGLNISGAKQTLATMKEAVNEAQNLYNAGSYDEAMDALQDFHMDTHPGDIESTIMKIRDIKNTIKRVKDAEIRSSVEKVLQEVVDKFNNAEYRDARETLDEYSDDIMNLLSQFVRTKNINRQQSNTQIKNLNSLIEKKLQEVDAKQGQIPADQLPQEETPSQSSQ